MQEFAAMCRDSELSAIEGMLPFWPRLYCALAIDIEHKVREAAQLAHAAVVKRVGKGIAMYLKPLAGAWFTSQYDTYPPAASAASNSFNVNYSDLIMIHLELPIMTFTRLTRNLLYLGHFSAEKSYRRYCTLSI